MTAVFFTLIFKVYFLCPFEGIRCYMTMKMSCLSDIWIAFEKLSLMLDVYLRVTCNNWDTSVCSLSDTIFPLYRKSKRTILSQHQVCFWLASVITGCTPFVVIACNSCKCNWHFERYSALYYVLVAVVLDSNCTLWVQRWAFLRFETIIALAYYMQARFCC